MFRLLTCFVGLAVGSVGLSQTVPVAAFDFLSGYPHVRDFALSAAGDEAYFTIQSPNEEIAVIACVRLKEGQWSKPEMVSFTGKYRDIEPFLAPGGLRLYFSSDRPLGDSVSVKDYDIWYVERKDLKSAWSPPVNLGKPVNTANNEFYPSVTQSGNLYFTSDAMTAFSKDDIYYSLWDGKKYANPVRLGSEINSDGYEFNAYVSPDEKMMIYTAYGRKDGFGSGDLYLSKRDSKGAWGAAVNMGATINSKQMDYCPFLDLSKHMFYFTSKRSTVEAKSFETMDAFLEEAGKYENGLSRVYKVSCDL